MNETICPRHGGPWGHDETCQNCTDLHGNVRPNPAEGHWQDKPVPRKLLAGVEWWLKDDAHAEDVVTLAIDGQDALILTGLSDVDGVAWVNPDGTVRVLRGRFYMEHEEEDEDD